MKAQTYTLSNYKQIPQITSLPEEQLEAIQVVGSVFPFETTYLIVNELIDWSDVTNDPVFKITFPQKYMLSEEHYKSMKIILDHSDDKAIIESMAELIRHELYPLSDKKSQDNVFEVIICEQQNRIRFFKGFQSTFFMN